jgi:type VII secretion-associated serine protease mycosin
MAMNRRAWISGIALLALALLVIVPKVANDGTHPGREERVRSLAPEQELKLKRKVLQRDLELTDALCRASCLTDAVRAVESAGMDGGANGGTAAPPDRERRLEVLQQLRKRNPRMQYLRWGDAELGRMPEGTEAKLEPLLKEAERRAAGGSRYTSGHVRAKDHHYFAIGVPSGVEHEPLIGVVQESVMREVEVEQKKNLRIVPYPSDARYRLEAVDSDTLRRRDVDHPEDNEGTSHYLVNEVVVKFRQEPGEADLAQIRRDIGYDSVRKMGYTHVFSSSKMTAKEMMEYFRNRWDPVYVEPHYVYLTNEFLNFGGMAGNRRAAGDHDMRDRWRAKADDGAENVHVPNDLLYSEYQWNLPVIETLEGWNISRGDESVIVAVLDTGIDLNHPDLRGKLAEGRNFVDESAAPDDDVGHGTHVAGIIAATVDNMEGVAGLSWYNRVMPVKVLDSTGAGSTYSVAQGIIWATDQGARVINMSLGNYVDAEFLHDAIRYAYDRDVVLIAATGNDNTEQPGYPAAYPEVFAVAATDWNNEKSVFSNYGDYVDVAAPGESIASTYYQQQYAALSGTSMASPHVAALAAMIRSVNPDLTNEEVMEIMRQTATDLGEPGKDKYYGYGLIDVKRALESAASYEQSILMWPKRLAKRLESRQ